MKCSYLQKYHLSPRFWTNILFVWYGISCYVKYLSTNRNYLWQIFLYRVLCSDWSLEHPAPFLYKFKDIFLHIICTIFNVSDRLYSYFFCFILFSLIFFCLYVVHIWDLLYFWEFYPWYRIFVLSHEKKGKKSKICRKYVKIITRLYYVISN